MKETLMDSTTLIVILAVIALLVIGAAAVAMQRSRSEALRRKFGPEYEQAVAATGDRRQAESELAARQKRVAALNIRPLAADETERYARAWQAAQTRFVDEPNQAIVDADRLVTEVMQARGYPVGDFEQRAADLSVEHANVLTHYRAAREIAQANATGQANTELLRQGILHYRALFADLLAAQREPERKELTK
jgi:hypothetical protein